MPWFKVDDKLHDHRKVRLAGVSAMGLWTLAGSWAAEHVTDGFVPATAIVRWDRSAAKLARRLVDAGLWHPAEQEGEQGWRFHEWEERQPTRDDLALGREQAKERMRKRRAEARSAGVRANSDRTGSARSEGVPGSALLPVPVPAAAADGGGGGDLHLPAEVVILRSKLEHVGLVVRWDTLVGPELAELRHLVELHGDGPLVTAAQRARAAHSNPPAYARAWLPTWRSLPDPAKRLAIVRDVCDVHHQEQPCSGCRADRIAAEEHR